MDNTKFSNQFIDFTNVFKGFIGTNYLSMPFAFSQSGIIFGILMLIIIGWIVDHCCHKIVICKAIIIKRLMHELENKRQYGLLPVDLAMLYNSGELKHRWECRMTLSHIAKYAYGKKSQWLVSICLFVLQFGFCTGYFVFIGNTLEELLTTNPTNNSWPSDVINTEPYLTLPYLILIPLPFYIGFSLLRTVRKIGWISAFALATVAFGYFSILGYIMRSFTISSDIYFIKFTGLPIVFGLLTSNLEGIGTIIPVESSMVGNRYNFPKYLHISIGLVLFILGSFGILGYLNFGNQTKQIFPQNLPFSIFISIVNCTFILGALCTYPLQMFPVIEIVEFLVFRKTVLSNTVEGADENDDDSLSKISYMTPDNDDATTLGKSHQNSSTDKDNVFVDGEITRLSSDINIINLNAVFDKKDERMIKIIEETNITVPAWKRNSLRILLVLLQMGLAIVMRHNYAYLIAFVGAIGGSFLVYILPAAVHYKLTTEDGNRQCHGYWDIFLMIFGVLGSVISSIVTLISVIKS